MNKALLIGNLTKDPELKTTQSGVSVCTFKIAVSRPYKRDETDYLNIVVWRGLAENCAKFLAKGRKVGIVGSIQTREYDDNNGQRRNITEIVADDVEFLTPKHDRPDAGHKDDDPPNTGFDPEEMEEIDDDQMPF